MNKKLKRIIKKHWNIKYKQFDKEQPLIKLAEDIVCESEKCTVEEAYNMYIDNPSLHLPGLVSFYIVDEMGLDATKVNANNKLGDIFDL